MTEVTRAPLGSGGAADLLYAFGVRRALLVTSPSLAGSAIVADVVAGLAAASIEVIGAISRPDRGDAYGIVSIGGGSRIRTAREIAGATGARHVAIPTTASCVEQFDGPSAPRPDAVIFDSRGIQNVPHGLIVSHAFNAMTFAVEALCGSDLRESAEMIALAAIAGLRRAVLTIIESGQLDDAIALALLRSAANAGIAAREGASVHGAPVGLARETGEALSERSPVLYATCVALMLPFALAYSRRDCTERIARIACAFEIPMTNDIVETADRVIAAIRALGQAGGLPSNFRKAGISRAAMEGAARAIAASPSALNFVRPVANVEQMMNEVFRFAW